jgi:hypothetical protein
MSQTSLKTRLLVLFILPLALGIIFAPVLFMGKTLLPTDQLNTMMLPFSEKYDSVQVYNHFLTDAIAQVYPYKVRWRANALRGEFASWNPMIFGGHAQYASTSFTHFDPTNFILLLGEMPAAYHWQMLAKLLIAGLGMWVLLGFFRVGGAGGAGIHALVKTMFALAYMLNSLFITTLQHQWLLGAFCWTPFALYFLLRCLNGEAILRNAVFAAVFLALACFGGSLQTSAIAILAIVVVALSTVLQPDESAALQKRLRRGAVIVLGIGALAFALSAVMWLPSLELFLYNENTRADGKAFTLLNSLKSLPLLVSFAIPELIGTPRGFDLAKIAQADMNDFNAFIGFAPFLFGVLGCFTLWNRSAVQTRFVRGFIVLCALGVLIPLATPLYKFIYHRSFILYVLGMSVVGALAAQDILFGEGAHISAKRIRQILRVATIGLGIIALALVLGNIILAWKYNVIYAKLSAFVGSNLQSAQLAAGSRAWMLGRIDVFLTHYTWRNPLLWWSVLSPILVLWLVRLVVKGALSRSQRLYAIGAMLLVTALQLWSGAASWLPMIDMERYTPYPSTHTTDFLRHDTTLHRFLPLFDAESQRVMQPNINDVYGIACVQGYESIFSRPAAQLAGALSQPATTRELRLSGLANVKYYIASAKNPYTHPAMKLVDSGATLIYQNLLAEDRAYMRYRYRVVSAREPGKLFFMPDRETYTHIFTHDSTFPAETVLLSEEPAEKIMRVTNTRVPHQITFLNYENNRVRLNVETDENGYLVLADSYYAGWKAFVNGQETPILHANYVLRSVIVPKGKSVVEFRFEPPLFRLGAWMSIGACVLCVILLILQMRKL